jgi:hypothetical protein
MCDTISGELLVTFHKGDAAAIQLLDDIRADKIPHVTVIESLDDRLERAHLRVRDTLEFRFYRLSVPKGEESWKINYLQFFYKMSLLDALHRHAIDTALLPNILGRSDYHLQVVPHSVLSVSSAGMSPDFTFSRTHDDYKRIIGVTTTAPPSMGKRVLVLDTGLDPRSRCPVISRKNLVDPAVAADDDHGHGTAVAEVIHDIAPGSQFDIYKVADTRGHASEWDTLAAVAADTGANVINLSLAFGLGTRVCPACGRQSHSSRSAVFEKMLDQLGSTTDKPIVVGAAGNDSLQSLSFPARFGTVIAIASVNKNRQLSGFTNRSTLNHEGGSHNNVFVLPGGDQVGTALPTEYIGASSSNGRQYYGTSFAAAYASGIIARLWADSSHTTRTADQLVQHLRTHADKSIPGYAASTHGNGLMRL